MNKKIKGDGTTPIPTFSEIEYTDDIIRLKKFRIICEGYLKHNNKIWKEIRGKVSGFPLVYFNYHSNLAELQLELIEIRLGYLYRLKKEAKE